MTDEVVMDEISGEFISDWVTKKIAAQDLGITDGVIRGWITNHLTKGIQYVVIGHVTLISRQRLQEWITQRTSCLTETERESVSPTKVRSIRSGSKAPTRLQLPKQYN